MPLHERRQHFRVIDHLYFDYRLVKSGEYCSDLSLTNQLLGDTGKKYMEAIQYFQEIDFELSELTQSIALKEPSLAHYLNLLNSKIDYLSHQTLMNGSMRLKKVDISLGGMAFKTNELIREKEALKIVIYTKPKMIPIILDATVVRSNFITETEYRTSVAFGPLTHEQEQLLSQHILLVQVKSRSD